MPGRIHRVQGWACAGILAVLAGAGCDKSSPPAAKPAASAAAAKEPEPADTGPAVPGWQAAFAPPGAAGGQVRAHPAVAAFALEKGESVDPAIPAAGFTAGYTGMVAIDEPGKYRFGIEAAGGTGKLTAFGKTGARLGEAGNTNSWTPWIDLPAGPVTVSVQFTREGDGAARLRTLWEREGPAGFRAEPVPPSAASVPKFGKSDAAAADAALHGRVLLGELSCTTCHAAGEAASAVITERPAPVLTEIGKRASPQWLAMWVARPQAVKPGSPMPEVLGDGPKDKADGEAIVHFLVSLGGPSEWKAAAGEGKTLDLGRRLYHTVGCIACHGPLEPAGKVFAEGSSEAVPEFKAPSPFGKLEGKWRPGALADFLQDPHASRPAGRMPSLGLRAPEAEAIAAYLVNFWGQGSSEPAFAVDPAKAAAGKLAFAARGCAACHEAGEPKIESSLKAKSLAELRGAGGCLDSKDAATPRYSLSEGDRADLLAGLRAAQTALKGTPTLSPIDQAERLIAALGCHNCHSRDGQGGPAEAIKPYFRTVDDTELGDEGRLPPHLTGVGMKLRPDWIRKVLGEGARARPYMATRMPRFGPALGDLGRMLAAMDGVAAGQEESAPKPTDETILAGRRLVGEHGLNCISCHAYGGKTAGTAGPDITLFHERLRPEWWRAYILAPTRFKPGTRMSEFFKGGHGTLTDVLGGDPDRQSRALWAYFTAGDARPAPEGLPSEKGIPINVGERPVIFRTFLEEAGNRGIAVGFPIGIHFGFDAEAVRLAEAWKGDFIDAKGAWQGRAGEVIKPVGERVWKAPEGPPLAIGKRPEGSWPAATGADAGYRFGGYRVEKDGTPVFLYSIQPGEGAGVVRVAERAVPRPKSGALVSRHFQIDGLSPGTQIWVNAGKVSQSTAAAEGGAKAEQFKADDGSSWWGLTPAAGAAGVVFTLEVTP